MSCPVSNRDDGRNIKCDICRRGGLRMVEFFSGIGGMRLGVEIALNRLGGCRDGVTTCCGRCQQPSPPALSCCSAYEISINANETYKHNFPDCTVTTKLVEQLKQKDLNGLADLWTMSPPCQPFTTTTNSKKNDTHDKRCAGFKAIMSLLERIHDRPRFIILENVKGFLDSDMLKLWYDCLDRCGYSYKEYLLSPTQIGIPNHRTRYYMICEMGDRFRQSNDSRGNLCTQMPGEHSDNETSALSLSHFIKDNLTKQEKEQLLIPEDVLQNNWARSLPVVSRHDCVSHCFTAAYGRVLHQATGSLLLIDHDQPIADAPINRSDMVQYSRRLRRFAPEELLKLFGFPETFSFPSNISLEHQYKLIGNSVNVIVVSRVAEELLSAGCSK